MTLLSLTGASGTGKSTALAALSRVDWGRAVSSSVPGERWEGWERGDPRWSSHIIDTDRLSADQVAEQGETWAQAVLDGRVQETENSSS